MRNNFKLLSKISMDMTHKNLKKIQKELQKLQIFFKKIAK